jgi:hypothetical protein
MKLTKEPTAFELDIPAILRKRKKAMKAYTTVKKQASQERIDFGQRLLQAKAKEIGSTVKAQKTQILNAFNQRTLAQRVKRLTGKQRGASLRSVTAPSNTNPDARIDCQDKLSIETAFVDEGTRRFSQTNTTPLMQPDFVHRVGYLAELQGADDILEGTYIPEEGTDPYAVQFISHLKMEASVRDSPPISKSISTESHQAGWKKMKPNISCSPFGPAFVQYIAGSRHPKIAAFDATMANIPYASGYSPEVWTKMIDVLIPKKPRQRPSKNSALLSSSTPSSI